MLTISASNTSAVRTLVVTISRPFRDDEEFGPFVVQAMREYIDAHWNKRVGYSGVDRMEFSNGVTLSALHIATDIVTGE